MRAIPSTPAKFDAPTANGIEAGRLALVFAIALAITGLPILLHLVAQPLAIACCVAGGAFAARALEREVPIIVLTANVFQNVFVYQASSNYTDFADIEPLKSYNFITTIVCWLVVMIGFVRDHHATSPFVRRIIFASLAVLAIVGLYFVAGLLVNPRNAIIYARNICMPILLLQMFLIVASKHELALPTIVSIFLSVLVFCGYIELFALDVWLTITNSWHVLGLFYAKRLTSVYELKRALETGAIITNIMDYTSSSFLNTSLLADLNLKVQRLQGPNLHPISFGYLLAIFITFAAVHGRRLVALLAFPLLLMTSAKGPLVLTIVCVGYYAMVRWRRDEAMFKGLLLALAAYAFFIFQSGFRSGDYHVLGLLGGLNGFMKNPIGHTLGDGGNLSVADFSMIDWSKYQHAGAAEIAVESAVGVLIYQLGVAAAAVLAFHLWIARIAWRLYRATGAPALAFASSAIAVTLVNGLFQEEAYFAPLALGLVMGFAGMALGAADRAIISLLADAKPGAPPPRPSDRPGEHRRVAASMHAAGGAFRTARARRR